MTDTHPTTGVPTTLRGSAVLLLWMLGAATTAGSVLGLLGDRPWFLDLFAHFRFQYAVGLLLAVIGMAVFRRWKSTGVFGAALLLNVVLIAPLWITPSQPTAEGPELKVIMFNVLLQNTKHDTVAEWLLAQDADLLVLQETGQAWADSMVVHLRGYQRIEIDTVREDAFGLMVFVNDRLDVLEAFAEDDPAGKPLAVIRLKAEGQMFTLVTGHPRPPVTGWSSEFRGWQFSRMRERVLESGSPVLVMGDLNATRWSTPLRRLLRDTELRDSAEGFGFQGTWPSGLWWTGMIPIDHVLVSPGIRVEDRRVGPDLGSDHRAVVVDLRLP